MRRRFTSQRTGAGAAGGAVAEPPEAALSRDAPALPTQVPSTSPCLSPDPSSVSPVPFAEPVAATEQQSTPLLAKASSIPAPPPTQATPMLPRAASSPPALVAVPNSSSEISDQSTNPTPVASSQGPTGTPMHWPVKNLVPLAMSSPGVPAPSHHQSSRVKGPTQAAISAIKTAIKTITNPAPVPPARTTAENVSASAKPLQPFPETKHDQLLIERTAVAVQTSAQLRFGIDAADPRLAAFTSDVLALLRSA